MVLWQFSSYSWAWSLNAKYSRGTVKSASRKLPAIAAVGGLLMPAALYAALNWNDFTALKGWGIPSATDIAFALGVLSLLGESVPPALKAFLLSVAIFDDIGAIIVIALFYTAELSAVSLATAAIFLLALLWLNWAGVTKPAAYFFLGIPLWIAVLKSGVHATLAGVVLAMFIPLRVPHSGGLESPLHSLEHALHPWVAFGILPLFAFFNAGVPLSGLSLTDLLHPAPRHHVGFISRQAEWHCGSILGGCEIWNRVSSGRRPLGATVRYSSLMWHRLHDELVYRLTGFRAR